MLDRQNSIAALHDTKSEGRRVKIFEQSHNNLRINTVAFKPVSDLVLIENVREAMLGNSGAVLISYRQFREFIIRTSYFRMVTSKNQRAKQTFIVLQDSTLLRNIEI